MAMFSEAISRQRWLPYKTRRSIIKRLHPTMLRDFSFETEFFGRGSHMRFRGNIVNYIDRLIYFCGAHEKYMLCLLRDYLSSPLRGEQMSASRRRSANRGGDTPHGSRGVQEHLHSPALPQGESNITFLDIGANAGNHSLFMAKLVAHVHAFEPYPRVREQLEDNLALNQITNITVHPFGLGNENAVIPFYAAPDSNLGAASFRQEHKDDNYYLGDMQIRCGDEVVAECGIKADIIKADVEGYEKFVLEGLQKTLRRDRPLLIIELSTTTRDTIGSAAAFAALFPERYRFYYFSSGNFNTGRYRLKPFEYAMMPKIQDVIACPEEKLIHLNIFGKK